MSTTLIPPPAREIPSTFLASLASWWSAGEKQSAASEQRLLRRLPFYPDPPPDAPVLAHSSNVVLPTPTHYLNTLHIESAHPSPDPPPPAVLLHGYGAGLGFYYKNLPTLAQWAARRGTSVFALDWLGMGRSARVPFTVKSKKDDIRGRVNEAESFFVDSLEEWRSAMGLEKMTLVGHSLGAYFSVAYALRYPTRVNKLVLLSPAGVPRDPNGTDYAREFTDTQDDAAVSTGAGAGAIAAASETELDRIRKQHRRGKRSENTTRRLLMYLWEEGWSPFQVVRSSFVWGPMLVGKVCLAFQFHHLLTCISTLLGGSLA
jgi:cardiolipin-specific phospholipase